MWGIRPSGVAEANLGDVAPEKRRGELIVTVDNNTDKNPQRLLMVKAGALGASDYYAFASYDLDSTNMSFGIDAGQPSGSNNVSIGTRSLQDISTGSNNTAIGYQSGLNLTTGSSNTFVGQNAAGLGVVTGTNNMVLGSQAGYDLTSGSNNSLIGVQAGENLTTGGNNIAIGTNAIRKATGASNITAVGAECFSAGTLTGQQHAGLGYRAGYNNTSGTGNAYFGYQSGYTNATGSANVAGGWRAGFASTSSSNVFLGYSADVGSTSHSQVIVLGRSANSTQSNEFVVGSSSYPINSLRIGEQSTGNPLILGDQDRVAALGYLSCGDSAGTPAAGDIRYNSSTNKHEGYNGTSWNAMY